MPRVIFWDVDTQYDFMHADGKLYVPDAERIIDNLKRLTDYAHGHGICLVASADDHVNSHAEISDTPPDGRAVGRADSAALPSPTIGSTLTPGCPREFPRHAPAPRR